MNSKQYSNQYNLSICPSYQENQLSNGLSLFFNHVTSTFKINNSLQGFLPIPQNMLSKSDDFANKKNLKQNDTESRPEQIKFEREEINVREGGSLHFSKMGLNSLMPISKSNTKNVLRNFGNAQNQFVLYNENARQIAEEAFGTCEQFYEWVRKLKLINFDDYQCQWLELKDDSAKVVGFKKLYKRLCWKFYTEYGIPYIYTGRLLSDSKKSHLKQIYKMLRGIKNPELFTNFKD